MHAATEDSRHPTIQYAVHTNNPFGTKSRKDTVVVWGFTLFEKICACQSDEDMENLIKQPMFRNHLKDRELGLFIQGDSVHYTTGAMHLPADAAEAQPSVSWRCSMNWNPVQLTREKCDRFVRALTHHSPLWHIPKVARQRNTECDARSLLDLSDLLVKIASSCAEAGDLHSLPRDFVTGTTALRQASRRVNDDAHALRIFIALSLFKCLGSAGLIDFESCWVIAFDLGATGGRPCSRGVQATVTRGAAQSPAKAAPATMSVAADAGDSGGDEDTDHITEFLEYRPAVMRNGSIIAGLRTVPGGSRYNKSPHGNISGVVTLQVGNVSHPKESSRNSKKQLVWLDLCRAESCNSSI